MMLYVFLIIIHLMNIYLFDIANVSRRCRRRRSESYSAWMEIDSLEISDIKHEGRKNTVYECLSSFLDSPSLIINYSYHFTVDRTMQYWCN